MEIIDMLKTMEEINSEYYEAFLKENDWAGHIMSVWNNSLFEKEGHGPWDAF